MPGGTSKMNRMSTPTPAHPKPAPNPAATDVVKPSNFLRQIIENDLEKGTYAARHWAGTPGDAAHHAAAALDPAKIRTRFPPEPNGYPHVAHATVVTRQAKERRHRIRQQYSGRRAVAGL